MDKKSAGIGNVPDLGAEKLRSLVHKVLGSVKMQEYHSIGSASPRGAVCWTNSAVPGEIALKITSVRQGMIAGVRGSVFNPHTKMLW